MNRPPASGSLTPWKRLVNQAETRTKMDALMDTFPGLMDRTAISTTTLHHIQQVLQTLTTLCASAAVGVFLSFASVLEFGQWAFLASAMAMMAYHWTPQHEQTKRQLLVYLFAFLQGQGIAPMVGIMQGFVLDALTSTSLVFGGFLIATVFFGNSRTKMYLVGIASSAATVMFYLTTFAWFMGRRAFMTELYFGMLSFAIYLVMDLQSMIDAVEHGHSKDVLHDALHLFQNLFQLFARVLAYLHQRDEKKRKERRRAHSG